MSDLTILKHSSSRRSALQLALRGAAVAGLAEILPSFARAEAAAEQTPLARAAVCIYLIGGSDSNNMLVPLDSQGYQAYASGRAQLALPQSLLLPVKSARLDANFGFYPHLIELRDLYSRGTLAVLANTGSLNRPTSAAEARAKGALPESLFQHSRNGYASYLPNGVLMPQWAVNTQDPDSADSPTQFYALDGVSLLSPQRLRINGRPKNNPVFVDALRKTQLRTQFPKTQLGGQLERIARILQASPRLGLNHPVLSATMSGFDTHFNQPDKQEALFADLSQSMSSFYAATEELGIADQVVTYTRSEFNRTLRPNRHNGTEHAWGGHELIMGGAVRGGEVYGSFPSLELGGADDAGADGIWVPTTSTQQYEAAIGYWHGVNRSRLSDAIEGLQNFPQDTLSFLG